jgi:hypothetical protein
MAHTIFDVISIAVLAGCLVKAARSFLVSDVVCVFAECIAAEWRRMRAHRAPKRTVKAPAAASANANAAALAGLEFSGD